MKKKYLIAWLVLFVFSVSGLGQTPAMIEQELIQHLKNISVWTIRNDRSGEDMTEALARERITFRTKLQKYTKRRTTLKYKFPELAKHMHIATSPDGKLRAYSWDTETGGSMHFYENVYQFESKKGLVDSMGSNLDEGDPGGFVSDILNFNRDSGSPRATFYVVRSTSILSTSLAIERIETFGIADLVIHDRKHPVRPKGGKPEVGRWERKIRLYNADLFHSEEAGEPANSLSVQYDFFSVVDRKERPIKLIQFNQSAKTLRVPIVIEDKKFPNGKVTNSFIIYKFNGDLFERVKG